MTTQFEEINIGSLTLTHVASKGGEGVVKVGGLMFFMAYCEHRYMLLAVSPWAIGGVWVHAPPENFGNLDTLRTFLMHSDTGFGTNFNTAYNENHHGKYNIHK